MAQITDRNNWFYRGRVCKSVGPFALPETVTARSSRRLAQLGMALLSLAFVCESRQACAGVPAPMSEAQIQSAILRVKVVPPGRSPQYGTAFVFMTQQRKLFLLTAWHVLTADTTNSMGAPAKDYLPGTICSLDRGSAAESMPCDVMKTFPITDTAVITANAADFPGMFSALPLGSVEANDPNPALLTYGYPLGGALRRDEGRFNNRVAFTLQFTETIVPDPGQSGSPLIDGVTHMVVGMVVSRTENSPNQIAEMVDAMRMCLSSELVFRSLALANLPTIEAPGALTASDAGMSLKGLFDNVSSPMRWYIRSKHYQKTDAESPKLGDETGWLGLHRTYSSSRSTVDTGLGKGWVHEFQYSIDMQHSTLCSFTVKNSVGIAEEFTTLQDCSQVKSSLATQVTKAGDLDAPLDQLVSNDTIGGRVLPLGGPSYVGADMEVSRAYFVTRGIEIQIGSTKYTFGTRGKLNHIHRGKFDVDLQYDAEGQVTLLSDGLRSMRLDYYGTHLVTASFSDGSIYRYGYSPAGDLATVSINGEIVHDYRYDAHSRLIHSEVPKDPAQTRDVAYGADGARTLVKSPEKEYRWAFSDVGDSEVVTRSVWEEKTLDEKADFVFNATDSSLVMNTDESSKVYHLTVCLCFPLDVEEFEWIDKDIAPRSRAQTGKKTVYSYDPYGRLSLIEMPTETKRVKYGGTKISEIAHLLDNGAWQIDGSYTYNEDNNLTQADNVSVQVSLGYDDHARIAWMTSGETKLEFTYNSMSKPSVITDVKLGSVTFTYKANGEVDKIESTGGADVSTDVMRKLQALIDVTAPAAVSPDNNYSRIDFVDGDRKCYCSPY